ncbi:hypothetical protein DBY68_007675 [Pseudocitrobacter sp. RIT415]|nr:hypothetical protein DBY68_007675 [Pseudocitrobacter sp. RIT 415]
MCLFVKLFLPILTISIDNEKLYRQNSHYHMMWNLPDDNFAHEPAGVESRCTAHSEMASS